jgi:hypothetical protein
MPLTTFPITLTDTFCAKLKRKASAPPFPLSLQNSVETPQNLCKALGLTFRELVSQSSNQNKRE